MGSTTPITTAAADFLVFRPLPRVFLHQDLEGDRRVLSVLEPSDQGWAHCPHRVVSHDVSCFSSWNSSTHLKKSCLQQLFELLIGCSILFNEVSVAAPAGNSRPPQSLGARMPSADHPKRPRNKTTQLIKYLCMGHEPVPRKLSQIFYDPFWRLLASPNTIKISISNSICSEKCISTSHQTQCLPLCGATARQSASLQFLAAPKGSNWFYAPPQTPKKMYRLSGKSIKIIITFTFFDPPKKGIF